MHTSIIGQRISPNPIDLSLKREQRLQFSLMGQESVKSKGIRHDAYLHILLSIT